MINGCALNSYRLNNQTIIISNDQYNINNTANTPMNNEVE